MSPNHPIHEDPDEEKDDSSNHSEELFTDHQKQQERKESESIMLRADDTLNNLPISDLNITKEDQPEYKVTDAPWFKELFGEELIEYFETYFAPFTNGRSYSCTQDTCQLENLSNYHFDDSGLDISNIYSERLSSSFSFHLKNKGKDSKKGIEYLKVYDSFVTMKDLLDFNCIVYTEPDILNTYLRLLDVFNEYNTTKQR